MPVIQPLVAERGLGGAPQPTVQRDTSVGRALQSLGGTVQDAADRLARMKVQNDDFAAAQGLKRFTGDFSVKFADMQANMDPQGLGLTKKAVEQFDRDADLFLAKVPPSVRGKYKELVQTERSRFADKAVVAELDRRDQWFATGVQDRTNELGAQVAQDPNSYEAALSDGKGFIDSTGWPEIRKQDEKRKLEATLKQARAGFYVRADPDHLLGRDAGSGENGGNAVDQVVARIIGAESGGNANAKNPNSSASGLGQFTNGTWIETVRRHRPDMALLSDREILSLKTNPALGREMTARHTEDNAAELSGAGLSVTPGTLYLAHFAGIGGAKAVLRAAPNTSLANVLDPAAMKANAFLKGKTAGWLRQWADRKMGEKGVYLSPETEGLPLQERLSIYDQALAASKARTSAAEQAANAEFNRRADTIDRGIETGEVTSREQILSAGLRDDDTARLLRRFDERNKEDNQARATLSAISAGDEGAKINPFDTDQVKEAENAWRYLKQVSNPDQMQGLSASFVQSSGYIPRDMQADLRRGAASKGVGDLSAAMAQADALQKAAPTAFDNFAGGDDVRRKLAVYRTYVNDLGMSGEQAAQRMLDADSDTGKRSREMLKTEAKAFVKDLSVGDVTDSFDTAFTWEPGAGVSPVASNALLAEYKSVAEEKFYETGGNADAAKALAISEIKRTWGVSNISGSANVMRLPPERTYPAIGGSQDYLREDAMQTAKDWVSEAYPERTVKNIFVMSDGQTRADIAAGRPPRYRLFYTYDQDGFELSDEVVGHWGVDAATQEKYRGSVKSRFMDERKEIALDQITVTAPAPRQGADQMIDPSRMQERFFDAAP